MTLYLEDDLEGTKDDLILTNNLHPFIYLALLCKLQHLEDKNLLYLSQTKWMSFVNDNTIDKIVTSNVNQT